MIIFLQQNYYRGVSDILNEDEVEKIKKEVKLEFPEDEALQQVHITRKIISKKVEKKGMIYIDYVNQLIHEIKVE